MKDIVYRILLGVLMILFLVLVRIRMLEPIQDMETYGSVLHDTLDAELAAGREGDVETAAQLWLWDKNSDEPMPEYEIRKMFITRGSFYKNYDHIELQSVDVRDEWAWVQYDAYYDADKSDGMVLVVSGRAFLKKVKGRWLIYGNSQDIEHE